MAIIGDNIKYHFVKRPVVDVSFNTSRNFNYSAYSDEKLQFVPPRKNEAGIAWGNPHNIFSIGDLH